MGAQVICRRIMFLKIRLFRICFVHVSYIMYLHLIVLFFRLSEAGLLTIGRLAESGLVQLDRSLLTALVDRWRPETNTFHLPCGEMTPTLQDVAMLLGLPISGDAVGPRVVPPTWLDDLEERFANIDIAIDVEEHPKATGPAKAWILQFQVHTLLWND